MKLALRSALFALVLIVAAIGVYIYAPQLGLTDGSSGQGAQQSAGGPGRGGGQPVAVSTATVEPETVPVFRRYTGTTVAVRGIEIRARVTGYLQERSFEEGSLVERGQTLYQIDSRPFENAITRLGAERDSIKANLEFLQKEVQRVQQLARDEFATESRLDELISQREQASANIRQLEAQIADAELDLEFSTITAPFSGRIGFSSAEQGALITGGGEPLTDLRQLDPMLVQFEPSDADLPLIQQRFATQENGLPVEVIIDEDGYYPNSGTLRQLENELDPTTGTIVARAHVENPEQRLLPGQFVRVRLSLGEAERLLVPTAALVTNQDQRAVYVAEGGQAALRVVETGRVRGKRTEILQGVEAGAEVITSNLQGLRDGAPIRVQDDGAGGSPTSADEAEDGRARS